MYSPGGRTLKRELREGQGRDTHKHEILKLIQKQNEFLGGEDHAPGHPQPMTPRARAAGPFKIPRTLQRLAPGQLPAEDIAEVQ